MPDETDLLRALTEGARELEAIAERVDVFGFAYPNADSALHAWQRGRELIDQLMDGVARGPSSSGASLWRTTNSGKTRWFVFCVDDSLNLRRRGPWGDGRPYELPAGLRTALVERHLSQMLATGDPETGRAQAVVHYGLGAELGRGGEMRLRVGGDE